MENLNNVMENVVEVVENNVVETIADKAVDTIADNAVDVVDDFIAVELSEEVLEKIITESTNEFMKAAGKGLLAAGLIIGGVYVVKKFVIPKLAERKQAKEDIED
jgi:hypothetical protein